ncbi:MAG: hypothetical protein KDA24_14605 [Deltaproteobacteria bacterium]|nr:hypothetical protein [Deltaproteobacteria bacterium]
MHLRALLTALLLTLLLAAPPAWSADLEKLLLDGYAALQEGDMAVAGRTAAAAVEAAPEDARSYLLLGLVSAQMWVMLEEAPSAEAKALRKKVYRTAKLSLGLVIELEPGNATFVDAATQALEAMDVSPEEARAQAAGVGAAPKDQGDVASLQELFGLEGAEVPKKQRGKAKKSWKLAHKAYDLMVQGEPDQAWTLVDKALGLYSDNPAALGLGAHLLTIYWNEGRLDEEGLAYRNAMQERLIEVAPGTLAAALAKTELHAAAAVPMVMPEPMVECPAGAAEQFAEAEQHFARGDMDEAADAYERGLSICPQEFRYTLYRGDADFQRADLPAAATWYRKSLEMQPCYWVAHRFLGDVESKMGHPEVAHAEYMRAVSCNPIYEAGWLSLQGIVEAYGVRWRRPPPGKMVLVEDADGSSLAVHGEVPEGDEAIWLVFATARVNVETGSAFEREQAALGLVLDYIELMRAKDPAYGGSGFWDLMLHARSEGHLPGAIWVHFMDGPLLEEFKTRKDEAQEEVFAYLSTFLTALTPEDFVRE